MIRFSAKDIPPKALELLWRDLTFPNPEYISRIRFGRWVGSTPKEIELISSKNDVLSIPRGSVHLLQNALSKVGERAVFDDRRVYLKPIAYTPKFELREYQIEAVKALAKKVQGCAVMPCGSGKSLVGAAAIASTQQPAIVLVHTKDLLEQWKSTLYEALGIEAGVVAEGDIQLKDVTVAIVQSLATMRPIDVANLGKRFGTVILDEAHHCPASVFRSTMSALAGKYRFGLTATPTRADGLSPLLSLCIGPIVFEIDHATLVDSGHLIIPRIISVQTGCAPIISSYSTMVASLIKNPSRNALIVDLALREAQAGKTILVLSGRVDHCHRLTKSLRANGVSAEALTGKVARASRVQILDRFRSGELSVICATSLADEGLDVASLERLILATPAQAESRTIQRLGRLMRPYPGKETPILYDLIDDCSIARKQQNARMKAYKKVLGKEAFEKSEWLDMHSSASQTLVG